MLAPSHFSEDNGVFLSEGGRITVTGSLIEEYDNRNHQGGGHGGSDQAGGMMGKDEHGCPITAAIVADGVTVTVRDDEDCSLWHGTNWQQHHRESVDGTTKTLSAEIVRIRRHKNGRFLDRGCEIALRFRGRNHRLFAAPAWGVKHLGLKLRIGDRVSVRGWMGTNAESREMAFECIEVGGR